MLRRADRILAPVTWVAAALTVLLLFAGPSLIGAKTDKPTARSAAAAPKGPDGKAIFVANAP